MADGTSTAGTAVPMHSNKSSKKALVTVIAVVAVVLVAVLAANLLGLVHIGASSSAGSQASGGQTSSDATVVSSALWSGNDTSPYVDQDGTECGNTPSNYGQRAETVSDSDYDYFYSDSEGGLCRAKKGSSQVDVILPTSKLESANSHTTFYLNKDGDTLYFMEIYSRYNESSDSSFAICSVGADGSGFTTLLEIPSTDKSTGSYSYISGLYLYDHTLYFVVESMSGGSKYSDCTYDVYTMDEDGSNQQKRCSIQLVGYAEFFVTKDKVYYTYNKPDVDNPEGSSRSSVFSQNLDGSNQQEIYVSNLDWIADGPIVQDGFVYVTESNLTNYAVGDWSFQLTRMDTSGNAPSVIWSGKTGRNSNSYYKLSAIAGNSVYLAETNDGRLASLISVPLSGGDSATLDTSFAGMDPVLSNSCDCLLLYGYGMGTWSSGAEVSRIGFDGTVFREVVG
ncbi:MAG: hypothetical protein SOI12_08285 [Tractidigestivibacter scatoligenes]